MISLLLSIIGSITGVGLAGLLFGVLFMRSSKKFPLTFSQWWTEIQWQWHGFIGLAEDHLLRFKNKTGMNETECEYIEVCGFYLFDLSTQHVDNLLRILRHGSRRMLCRNSICTTFLYWSSYELFEYCSGRIWLHQNTTLAVNFSNFQTNETTTLVNGEKKP